MPDVTTDLLSFKVDGNVGTFTSIWENSINRVAKKIRQDNL